jgi:hypothetical protein
MDNAFKTMPGILTKLQRCFLAMEAVQEHFARLAQEIENVSTALIFNADESGEMRTMPPASYPHNSIEIMADRFVKLSMMLASVSGDGSYLKPMMIAEREIYQVNLNEAGPPPAHVLIVHRKCGFINRNQFQPWAERMLFPAIERRRVECDYEGDAIVIPDGCTSHDSDWPLEEALARLVILPWLPLHSCDKTQ